MHCLNQKENSTTIATVKPLKAALEWFQTNTVKLKGTKKQNNRKYAP